MRISKVPVDMSSEQKEILGILSKRQLGYLVVGGLVLYAYLPIIFKFAYPLGWLFAFIFTLITALPVLVIVGFLGFFKVSKFNMNRDFYYFIKFTKKSQYGSWRKGF